MIFLDFDGTIVDVWERYYRVFCAAAEIQTISKATYVAAKKKWVRDDIVAEQMGISLPKTYYQRKRVLLESEEFLQTDTLVVCADELIELFRSHSCRILTSRRNKAAFYHQLIWLGLEELKGESIVLHPDEDISKKEYLEKNYSCGENVVVGDAEAEWSTALLPNTRAVLVRTGLREPEDFVLSGRISTKRNISEFIANLNREGLS